LTGKARPHTVRAAPQRWSAQGASADRKNGNIMGAISRKVGVLVAALGLLAIGFQGCSANDELTSGSEQDVATTEEAITRDVHECAQYEAEAMTRIGLTGTTSGGITLFQNTSALQQYHSFDPGPQLHGIVVYARGTPANNIWPKMRLKVNNVVQGPVNEVTVSTQSWAPYFFYYSNGPSIANLPIKIEFTNDGVVNGQDRNLHIDGISLSCPVGVRCGTNWSSWCDTNGTGNVCCVNSNGSNPTCQSAASCNVPKIAITCDNHWECSREEPSFPNVNLCLSSNYNVDCRLVHLQSYEVDCHSSDCICKSPGMSQEKSCPTGYTCQPIAFGSSWKACQ
jgi:hypothetical protein